MQSPTTLGMSLETFISRDLEVLQHQLQAMESEQNQDNADELSQTNEKITTEDILGRTDGSSRTARGICFSAR